MKWAADLKEQNNAQTALRLWNSRSAIKNGVADGHRKIKAFISATMNAETQQRRLGKIQQLPFLNLYIFNKITSCC